MKFMLLSFLVAAAGFLIYTPNFSASAGGDIVKRNIIPFHQSEKYQQPQINKEQSESMRGLKGELGLDPDKPLVETEIISPVAGKLINEKPKDSKPAKAFKVTVKEKYLEMSEKMKFAFSAYGPDITSIAIIMVVIAVISKCLRLYSLAYLLSKLGWFFSRFALVICSIAAILSYFVIKKNLWQDAGYNLFFIPLQILIASSLSFKALDSNFPIWNRLFGSFVLPILSGLVVNAAAFFQIGA